VAPTLEWWEMGLRLLAAAGLGGLIGFEREFNEQPAGFRTHILVTLGSALFTMAGAYGIAAFVDAGVTRFDPTRVAAQVVTGIGFLGAGAILRQGINIRGLTTAASIWVTASIGVAVALGFWAPALITTALALISLLLLRPIQRVILRSLRQSLYKVVVDLEPEGRVAEVNEVLERIGVNVRRMRTVGLPNQQRQLILDIEISEDLEIDGVAEQLRSTERVSAVDWTR
jgi:putative Mg2+ transporter-C (MgtC) family protein